MGLYINNKIIVMIFCSACKILMNLGRFRLNYYGEINHESMNSPTTIID